MNEAIELNASQVYRDPVPERVLDRRRFGRR
jgi:hypothetical protein